MEIKYQNSLDNLEEATTTYTDVACGLYCSRNDYEYDIRNLQELIGKYADMEKALDKEANKNSSLIDNLSRVMYDNQEKVKIISDLQDKIAELEKAFEIVCDEDRFLEEICHRCHCPEGLTCKECTPVKAMEWARKELAKKNSNVINQ